MECIKNPGNPPATLRFWLQRKRQLVAGPLLRENFIVFLAYIAAGKLGQATTNIRSSNLGPVWPAFGIAVAAVLFWGYRVWIGILAAGFLVAFLSPVSHLAAFGQAVAATLAAVAGAAMLHRVAGFQKSLSRLSDALSLIAIGGFGSAVISATIGVSVLYLTRVHAYSGLGAEWLIYWLGDATGVLLVTPLALRIGDFMVLRDRDRLAEFILLCLLNATACLLIFGDVSFLPIRLHVLAFAVLPFVIWAAIRFGLGITALLILLIAAIATVETALGSGPFAGKNPFVDAVLLDVFFGVLSVTGLSLAAVIAERENAERERERIVSKQAAIEARAEASEILRESEERLRLAAEVGKMYAYDWDVATDRVVRSEQSRNILGSAAEAVLSRQEFLARVHPDDRAKYSAAIDQVTPANPSTHITYRVFRADGGLIWLEKHGRGFFDAQGKARRIIGMVADITERKLAEDKLREYEKAVEGAEEMIVVVDREHRYRVANREFLKRMNLAKDKVIGHFVRDSLNREVYEKTFQPKLEECFEGKVIRYELKYPYPELGERDLLVSCFPIEGINGVDRAACILLDITDRKRAEEAVAQMSRNLIDAQEQERTRIARELHDNINQRLALLSVELEAFRQNPPESAAEVSIVVTEIRARVNEISSDVQSLSHELHSSQLEYLGIVAAARGFCRELAASQDVEIVFTSDDIPKSLSREISLCLFRVLQEALHNAIKYSKVGYFEVRLASAENKLQLTVSDRGIGFEPHAAFNKGGLGLTSMMERVRLVNGTIAIDSEPTRGTSIHVSVPFEAGHELPKAV